MRQSSLTPSDISHHSLFRTYRLWQFSVVVVVVLTEEQAQAADSLYMVQASNCRCELRIGGKQVESVSGAVFMVLSFSVTWNLLVFLGAFLGLSDPPLSSLVTICCPELRSPPLHYICSTGVNFRIDCCPFKGSILPKL